jgi:cell division protein FtsI/penicillin-binding protein 2
MTATIGTVFELLAARRARWRRAYNLRAGQRRARVREPAWRGFARPSPALVIGALGAFVALAGAWVLVLHAERLWRTAEQMQPGAAGAQLASLQALLPGAVLDVPARPGVTLNRAGKDAVLVLAGMQPQAPVHIDLCAQMADAGRARLLPLRIGYRFEDVARWVAHNDAFGRRVALRNVVLASAGSAMPKIDIGGDALPGFAEAGGPPLRLNWQTSAGTAQWIGDDAAIVQSARGTAPLWQDGWLTWQGLEALRILRRRSAACAAGELVVQLYRAGGATGNALVWAFAAGAKPRSAWLPPGTYEIAATAPPGLEDQGLFERLQARGLVRLGPTGLVELAPPDLAAYLAAPAGARAAPLPPWDRLRLDDSARALLDRLYHKADGEYVREQVRVFNSERRLLAWRMRPTSEPPGSEASIAGMPARLTGQMPSVARLFERLPEGWAPWSRVADWPANGASARIKLALAQPAAAGQTIQLMLAGHAQRIDGARLAGPPQAACTGRACPSPDAVQVLTLSLAPGARQVSIDAAPLDMSALATSADLRYRHLRVDAGRLVWQSLPARSGVVGAPPATNLSLADRNGASLWRDDHASREAMAAGLGPLLGLRPDHLNSIAGMLARLAPAGAPHQARLTLDLALQAASQAALDCIGMRRGRLDGARCEGATSAPAARAAGVVVLDTETGDILAAAGAGPGRIDASNWREVRDFDRVDPAASPLRLPAFQHDGAGNRSPGSTFKIISALGLELAAQRDPQLEALLGGMPLARINDLARDDGFAFRTEAPTYPFGTKRAHITNFRDQGLDRRARDGRLGLAQALTYSLNTWFAWTGELSDRSLFHRPDGGAPDLQPLEPDALAGVRPIVRMAQLLGFEQPLRLDGGLLPPDYRWSPWDALQSTPAHIDPVHSRHEVRQMAIGLRMQATPLQMALAAGAVGQGRVIVPRLLLALDGRAGAVRAGPTLGVRLDRIRAGMKGVIDVGTAAGAFRAHAFDSLRRGLYGKTGTAPTGERDDAGHELATVWFAGWLEPGSMPGQTHRLALAAFVSHSEATGGEHAAPIVAAVLSAMMRQYQQQQLNSVITTRQ